MDEIDPLCRLEIRVAKRRDVLEMNRLNREALPENYPLSYWREQVAHKNSFVANRLLALEDNKLMRVIKSPTF